MAGVIRAKILDRRPYSHPNDTRSFRWDPPLIRCAYRSRMPRRREASHLSGGRLGLRLDLRDDSCHGTVVVTPRTSESGSVRESESFAPRDHDRPTPKLRGDHSDGFLPVIPKIRKCVITSHPEAECIL